VLSAVGVAEGLDVPLVVLGLLPTMGLAVVGDIDGLRNLFVVRPGSLVDLSVSAPSTRGVTLGVPGLTGDDDDMTESGAVVFDVGEDT